MGPIMRATLRSLGARWGSVLVTGFYVLLLETLLMVCAILPAWYVGGMIGRLLDRSDAGGSWWMGLLAVLTPLVGLVLLVPRMVVALAYMASRVRRGEAVSLTHLWAAGNRFWWPMFNYLGFLAVAGFLWAIAGLITTRHPLPPLFWEAISTPFAVCLGGYGVYLIVAEQMLPADALRKAWVIFTRKTADVLVTSLILFVAGQVLDGAVQLLKQAPVAGAVVSALGGLLGAPLATLYLAHRYHANIGPTLTPPGGGAGSFDARPFAGP